MNMDADIIIVGSGPARSSAARHVAYQGISVLVLDKATFPRRKICAAGLLEHTFRDFPEVKPFLDCYNSAVRVVSPNLETQFEVKTTEPLMAMTQGRYHFDNELLKMAQKAGAAIHMQREVQKVQTTPDHVQIITKDGTTFTSKIVIGADSANSIVARSLHMGFNIQDPKQMGLAVEKEFPLSEKIMDEYFTKDRTVSLYLHFGKMLGYGWIFPRKTSLNLGIGSSIQDGHTLTAVYHQFITHLKSKNIIPLDIPEGQPDAAMIPTTFPTQKCVAPRAIIIGDAGGFCSSATGEGIYYALMSGKIAAESCTRILKTNQFSYQSMNEFYKTWQQQIGNELKFQYFANQAVLSNERRCRAAVNWASQDNALKEIFMKFLTGQQSYRRLGGKMGYHYVRCKVKDKLHIFTKPQCDKDFEKELKQTGKW